MRQCLCFTPWGIDGPDQVGGAAKPMAGQPMNVLCRTGANEWRAVLRHRADGLDVEERTMTFEEVCKGGLLDAKSRQQEKPVPLRWEDLLVPLPDLKGPTWAYAFTYRMHQEETGLGHIFFFEKHGKAESACGPIKHRPALDYEAELALLLNRNDPERFGFLLANDLTDRAVQVHNYDRRRPGSGFSVAKSFPGALRIGPLLVMAGGSLWPQLESATRGERSIAPAREGERVPDNSA